MSPTTWRPLKSRPTSIKIKNMDKHFSKGNMEEMLSLEIL